MRSRAISVIFIIIGLGVGAFLKYEPTPTSWEKIPTHYGNVELEFPSSWSINPDENPFDLQCLSRSQQMNTGVFVYVKEDYEGELIPAEVFQEQIEILKSLRKNFRILEEQQFYQLEDKKLTTVVYSGEKNRFENYYKFTLIEFNDHPERFAITLQISTPEVWEKAEETFKIIVDSASVV